MAQMYEITLWDLIAHHSGLDWAAFHNAGSFMFSNNH